MAKRLVRWRIEGETLVDTDDEERSLDSVRELIEYGMKPDIPLSDGLFGTQTKIEEPEMLSSELVDWGTK